MAPLRRGHVLLLHVRLGDALPPAQRRHLVDARAEGRDAVIRDGGHDRDHLVQRPAGEVDIQRGVAIDGRLEDEADIVRLAELLVDLPQRPVGEGEIDS
jgi:hypothetical protein